MRRYSPERKEAVLKKLLPPYKQTAAELTRKEGQPVWPTDAFRGRTLNKMYLSPFERDPWELVSGLITAPYDLVIAHYSFTNQAVTQTTDTALRK